MTSGYFRQFLSLLEETTSQQHGLANAIEFVQEQAASELSRCLRGLCLDVVTPLRELDLPGWKIIDKDETSFSEAVLSRCHHYLKADEEQEFSTALVAQLLFRADSKALGQVRLALHGGRVLPAPIRVRDVANVARQVTAGVALSYALPADASTDDIALDFEGENRPLPFERSIISAARSWAAMPIQLRTGPALDSAALVRLALGRGADQRVSRWLQAIGLNLIDFARVRSDEAPSDAVIGSVPATSESESVWRIARALAEMRLQALSADRLVLASLTVPSSYLSSHLIRLFGRAVNLPLLYLRTAIPPGISHSEATWLIATGDINARPGPSAAAGDLCAHRVTRLCSLAEYLPGYEAVERMNRYSEYNKANNDFPVRDSSFIKGDVLGVVRLLAVTDEQIRNQAIRPVEPSFASRLSALQSRAALPNGEESWSYGRLRALLGTNLADAYVARRQLAASQPGQLGLRILFRLGPSTERIGDVLEAAPDIAVDAVGVAHCLESGVFPFASKPVNGRVRLVIGGADGRYALAVVAPQARTHVHFELSEQEALIGWQAMRKPALAGSWTNVASAMQATASLLGLDRVAHLLNDADIEFTVVRPFDGFMVDQLIRAVARPRSVIHRVFGAGAGTWAGDYALLRGAGGARLVVDDPTDSLASSTPEAIEVSRLLAATRIGGPGIRRATVLRLLETAEDRPAIIHFTGHGVSGLIGPNGEITSGVLAANQEAIGIASLASAAMPRVLIATACDVGSTPPVARSTAWSTSAIANGASYSLAPGIPIDDTSAMVFGILTSQRWAGGEHLEDAVATVARLGRSPADLLAAWTSAPNDSSTRRIGTSWIRGSTATEVAHSMGAYSLCTA